MADGGKDSPPAPRKARAGRRRLWRIGRAVGVVVAILLLGLVLGLLWGWQTLRGSLPLTDAIVPLPGLAAPVTVTRDDLGIPTITGETELDVARATGFVHAQERFFQMDLIRRKAAGELAELFGDLALAMDKSVRVHRFRARAARVVAAATSEEQALLAAYAAGVNNGLQGLRQPAFEYLLLRADPAPWTPEDSVLVALSMFLELQDGRGIRDWRRGLMREHLPGALVDFITSLGSSWDTPILGPAWPPPPIPGPEVIDLRQAPIRAAPRDVTEDSRRGAEQGRAPAGFLSANRPKTASELDLVSGSNGWVLSGAHTADGAPLLANDLHLPLSVPNTWYRAVLQWGENASAAHRVVGATLPGVPAILVGSNGHIAWGVTNAEIDTSDLVVLTGDPADPRRYLTPQGSRSFQVHEERIRVRDAPDQILDVRETIWGPVFRPVPGAPEYALRWVAHDPEGVNLRFMSIGRARSLSEAQAIAQESGIPVQNILIADASGSIGWTLAGQIPHRVGFTGQIPESWSDAGTGWNGWLSPEETPTVIDPEEGWLVTANNRLVGGGMLRRLGETSFDQGARARQILNGLRELDHADAEDMLRIQLDDRALFLARWRQLALDVLDPGAIAASKSRHELHGLLEHSWSGRASPDSVAYRLVRGFRRHVARLAFAPILAPVRAQDPSFPDTPGRAYEGPLWQLVTARPAHLLDPQLESWDALLLAALDQTAADLRAIGPLAERTWGEVNRLAMRHPLSGAVSGLSTWLDMPTEALPGDVHMPRVQSAHFGASLRLVVSPGHEFEGLFQVPGGQGGHPLSSTYRAGHDDWAAGRRTALLPGAPVRRLQLLPDEG